MIHEKKVESLQNTYNLSYFYFWIATDLCVCFFPFLTNYFLAHFQAELIGAFKKIKFSIYKKSNAAIN